ncbi:hypothetical protein B0H13DRAFT_1894640 [Mycena leptocephala]|nr:hypothetical protein B0H13DRAFT_1894640 [Mycena leptocephala]
MPHVSLASDLDEDDPATVRRLKPLQSSRAYDEAHRVERNLKKKDRMATLRAQRAQDPPDIAEARRLAACETARKYRERNREHLAEKARAERAQVKVRAKVAFLKKEGRFYSMIRRREREIRRLPLVVPATWSLHRRQEAFNAREALIARESEVLSSEDEDKDNTDVEDAEEEDSDSAPSAAPQANPKLSSIPHASLQMGERFTNIDYALTQSNAGETTLLPVSYDLACQWGRNVQARNGDASTIILFILLFLPLPELRLKRQAQLLLRGSVAKQAILMNDFRCDPPFYPANPERPDPLLGRKIYLVCGQNVKHPGAYEDWTMADLQYRSVSNASIKSYYDWSELKAAWYTRCDAGQHDHPAAPPAPSSAPTTPQRNRTRPASAAAALAPATAPLTHRTVAVRAAAVHSGSQIPQIGSSSMAGPSSGSASRTPHTRPRARLPHSPPLPLHVIASRSPSPESRSPSLDPPPSQSQPPPPPPYAERTPSTDSNVSVSVGPIGLMYYAVRVGTEGESFTDPDEARTRFFALQAAGENPGFVAAASLARAMRWIEDTPPATSPWTAWMEREDRARRRRVAEQRAREAHRCMVLDALVIRRAEDSSYDSDASDQSRSTADLEGELGARETLGNHWREM